MKVNYLQYFDYISSGVIKMSIYKCLKKKRLETVHKGHYLAKQALNYVF